jgi:hypothetical protein
MLGTYLEDLRPEAEDVVDEDDDGRSIIGTGDVWTPCQPLDNESSAKYEKEMFPTYMSSDHRSQRTRPSPCSRLRRVVSCSMPSLLQ